MQNKKSCKDIPSSSGKFLIIAQMGLAYASEEKQPLTFGILSPEQTQSWKVYDMPAL